MNFKHKQKNHTAKYLCNHWIHYERNVDSLQPEEVLNAKYLFWGLQKLNQDERLFLATQYRTARGKRYTDGEISAIKGITVEEHKKQRIECETALQNALKEVYENLND